MRRVWAVARTTLREAIRSRTAIVILIAVVAVVGLSPFLLRGTGKLSERIQLVLSYSLGAVGFLLSIMTIFLAASTLAGDLREQRIETIVTKPVPRWQILVGKWVGVMILNVVLVIVSGGTTYLLVRYVIGNPSDDTERQQLKNEVYVARHTVKPTPPDKKIEQTMDDEIRRKREAELLPEGFDEAQYRRARRKTLRIAFNDMRPGHPQVWEFRQVMPTHPHEPLFIRYKVVAAGPGEGGAKPDAIWLAWAISANPRMPIEETYVPLPEKVSLGDFHMIAVPAGIVRSGSGLYVAFTNITNHPRFGPLVYAAFPAEEGIQLLYRAGSFEWNFVRTMILLLVRLAFLSALALAAAALLSFPVASLFVLFVFACALMVSHFLALAAPVGGADYAPVYQASPFHRMVLKAVSAAVPSFSHYDGATNLATGRLVPWRLVVRGILIVGALYGGVVMLLGCLHFAARELAGADGG